MASLSIALLLRPFVALVLFGLVLLPIRLAVQRFMPPGRVKSFLLLPVRRKHP
jgi:hypothetical protein